MNSICLHIFSVFALDGWEICLVCNKNKKMHLQLWIFSFATFYTFRFSNELNEQNKRKFGKKINKYTRTQSEWERDTEIWRRNSIWKQISALSIDSEGIQWRSKYHALRSQCKKPNVQCQSVSRWQLMELLATIFTFRTRQQSRMTSYE